MAFGNFEKNRPPYQKCQTCRKCYFSTKCGKTTTVPPNEVRTAVVDLLKNAFLAGWPRLKNVYFSSVLLKKNAAVAAAVS